MGLYGRYTYFILSVMGSTLESDVYRRQILTSEVVPCAKWSNQFWLDVGPLSSTQDYESMFVCRWSAVYDVGTTSKKQH